MITKEQSKCRGCKKLDACVCSITELIEREIDKAELHLVSLINHEHFQNIVFDVIEHFERRGKSKAPNAARLRESAAFLRANIAFTELGEKEGDFRSSSAETKALAVKLLADSIGNEAAGASVIATFFSDAGYREALVSEIKTELAKRSRGKIRKGIYAQRSSIFCEMAALHDLRSALQSLSEREGDFSQSSLAIKLQAVSSIVDFFLTIPRNEAGAGIFMIIHDKYPGLLENLRSQIVALNEQASTPGAKEFFDGLEEFSRTYAAVQKFDRFYQEALTKIKDTESEAEQRKVVVGALFECMADLMPNSWKRGLRDEEDIAAATSIFDKMFERAKPLIKDVLREFMRKLSVVRDDNELAYYFTLMSHLQGKVETEEKRKKAEAAVGKFFSGRERNLPAVLALMDEAPETAEAVAKFAFVNGRKELFDYVRAYLAEKAKTDQRYQIVVDTAETNEKARVAANDIIEKLTELVEKLQSPKDLSVFGLN